MDDMLLKRRSIIVATIFAVLFCAFATNAHAQRPGSTAMRPRVISPAEYLTGDTTRVGDRTSVPGGVIGSFSPLQDTLYKRALAVRVTSSIRFRYQLVEISNTYELIEALEAPPTPWESITGNMNIPTHMFKPSEQEVVQHQINIANSMHVPGVLLTPMGTGNLQVSFGAIAKLFGLEEDVSPRIRYLVDETIEVTIVIYAASAVRVATIFNGIQGPGAYEIVWNGLDDDNRTVADGDYIAEVRMGNQRMQRKRILWPSR